jgi:hypothetical protein
MDRSTKRPKGYMPLDDKLVEVCRGRFALDPTKTKLFNGYSSIVSGRETALGTRKHFRTAYGRRYIKTTIFTGKLFDYSNRAEITLCYDDVVAVLAADATTSIMQEQTYEPAPPPGPRPEHAALARYYEFLERCTGLKVF